MNSFERKQKQKVCIQDNKNSQNLSASNNSKKQNKAPQKNKLQNKLTQNLIVNISETQYSVVEKVANSIIGVTVTQDSLTQDWDLCWTDNAVTSEQLGRMKTYQKINHFPGMYTLSRKNYLAQNLIKMQKQFPNEYNFFPRTFVLPSEFYDLKNYMEKEPNSVLIAKPKASSQGKGIFLTKSFEDFQFGEHYVVQKYLKKPFLIDGLKFDLRIYVLVSGCQPLRIHIYKQGLARFATQQYNMPKKQNMKNLFMHLTNYSINKNSEKFQFNDSVTQMDRGHKRSLTSVLDTIQHLGHSKLKVWEDIKSCIAKTMISAQPLLAHQYRSSQPNNMANNMCFEILGFDFILDSNLKAEILEVNYTPSFTTDTPLDFEIKKQLIHDTFKLISFTQTQKAQIINEQKREMKERTLTGKKFYYERDARQKLLKKIERVRNKFESENVGNFERILPVSLQLPKKGDIQSIGQCSKKNQIYFDVEEENKIEETPQMIELNHKYKTLLQYSAQCYNIGTGTNIKRYPKPSFSLNKNTNEILAKLCDGDLSEEKTQSLCNNYKQMTYNKSLIHLNSENLANIYKSKICPTISKKKAQSIQKHQKQTQMNQLQTSSNCYEMKEKQGARKYERNPIKKVSQGRQVNSSFKQMKKMANSQKHIKQFKGIEERMEDEDEGHLYVKQFQNAHKMSKLKAAYNVSHHKYKF